MRNLLVILLLITTEIAYAQYFFAQEETTISVAAGGMMHFSGEAMFYGGLENQGSLELDGHVDFGTNTHIGDVALTGDQNQVISGNLINAQRFELNKNGTASLALAELVVSNELALRSGILSTGLATLYVESGLVSGGSEGSFVQGGLTIQSPVDHSEITFPVGVEGKYLPFTFHSPSGRLKVAVSMGDTSALFPGELVVGVASEAVWQLSHEGGDGLNSKVSLDYVDFDFENLAHRNPIRSSLYSSAILKSGSHGYFESMGISPESDQSMAVSGRASSDELLHLKDTSVSVAVGVVPVSSGLKFYVPSVFTPSGEMVDNKKFRAFLADVQISKSELRIWDTRNNKIFEEMVQDKSLEDTGWDGGFQGADAPQGIYYYSLRLTTGSAGVFEKEGTVLLLR